MFPAPRSCLKYLPSPRPATNAAQPNAAAFIPPTGSSSEDRISKLPEDVQRAIISKLPVKDGGATVVLSTSWRWIWSSIPLALDDAQLRPAGAADELEDDDGDYYIYEDMEDDEEYEPRDLVKKKVTEILRSHPGPFQSVRLTSSPASSLRAWLHIMAAKRVEELVVLNSVWPAGLMALSVKLLRCRSLKRLHLALCQMPRLTAPATRLQGPRRRTVDFPNLQELVLCHAFVPASDIGDLLAGCPALEMLAFIEGHGVPQFVDLRGARLRCLLLWRFKPNEITLDAPRLERVIVGRTDHFLPPRARIIIRRAPSLRVIGYLDPEVHELHSRDTVIKAGTRPNRDVMLPSVEIVAVKVRFGVRENETTLLSYLRLFPNTTTLHIQSAPAPSDPENEHGRDFWSNDDIFNRIECISKIKKFSFYGFHGMDNRSELSFIKSIAQKCDLLEHMLIVISGRIMESPNRLKIRLANTMSVVEWASEESTLDIISGNHKEWEYGTASDQSLSDPFEYI